eukprot:19163-Pelagococcus_subviridis.AAC.3
MKARRRASLRARLLGDAATRGLFLFLANSRGVDGANARNLFLARDGRARRERFSSLRPPAMKRARRRGRVSKLRRPRAQGLPQRAFLDVAHDRGPRADDASESASA